MWEIITSNIEVLQAMPVLNIQLLLDGIFIGAIFALAAYGLALVWGVMNVKNLAQGDFVIMGGYIAWWMSDSMGVPPILGLPVNKAIPETMNGPKNTEDLPIKL